MIAAWGFVLPAGAMMPLCWRRALPGKGWLRAHMSFQLVGVVLTAVGLGLSIGAVDLLKGEHFSTSGAGGHKAAGLVVGILAAVQIVLAFMRPHPPKDGAQPTVGRRVWSWSHRIAAITLLVLTIYTVVKGAERIEEYFAGDPSQVLSSSTLTALYLGLLGGGVVTVGGCGLLLGSKNRTAPLVKPPDGGPISSVPL